MSQTLRAIETLRNELRRQDGVDVEAIESTDKAVEFSARYVGDWEVPADEEDDGDYDWKVPTQATRTRLDKLMADYSKRFGVTVSWHNEGEKCWIRFMAE